MKLNKSISAPENLNKQSEIKVCLEECTSFNDFEKLIFSGEQKKLTFGEYSQKKNSDKNKRRRIISYFYKNLYSKL